MATRSSTSERSDCLKSLTEYSDQVSEKNRECRERSEGREKSSERSEGCEKSKECGEERFEDCADQVRRYLKLQRVNLQMVGQLLCQMLKAVQQDNLAALNRAKMGLKILMAKPFFSALINYKFGLQGLQLTGTPTLFAGLQTANSTPQTFNISGNLTINGTTTSFSFTNLITADQTAQNLLTLSPNLVIYGYTKLQITLVGPNYTVGTIDPIVGSNIITYTGVTPQQLLLNIQRDFNLQPTLNGNVLTLTDSTGNNIVFGGASAVTVLTSRGVALNTFTYSPSSPSTIYVGIVEVYSTSNPFIFGNLSPTLSSTSIVGSMVQIPFLLPYYVAQYIIITTLKCKINLEAPQLPLCELLNISLSVAPSTLINLIQLITTYLANNCALLNLYRRLTKLGECDTKYNSC